VESPDAAASIAHEARKAKDHERGQRASVNICRLDGLHELCPVTNSVQLTRDVNWLRRKFSPDSPVFEAGERVVVSVDNFPPRMSSNTPVVVPAEKVNILSTDAGMDTAEMVGDWTDKESDQAAGEVVDLPECLRENYEMANTVADDYHIQLTPTEVNYYATMRTVEHGLARIALDDGRGRNCWCWCWNCMLFHLMMPCSAANRTL
jgi:hypothetical protein